LAEKSINCINSTFLEFYYIIDWQLPMGNVK